MSGSKFFRLSGDQGVSWGSFRRCDGLAERPTLGRIAAGQPRLNEGPLTLVWRSKAVGL